MSPRLSFYEHCRLLMHPWRLTVEVNEQILAVFERFQERISDIEELIKTRNEDKKLKNRYGHVQLPYELLYPSSDYGMTGKGVPNSTSI